MLPRLLVTGGSGFLGSALRARAASSWQLAFTYLDHEPAVSSGLPFRLDLREAASIERVLRAARPQVVIHTASRGQEPDLEAVVAEGSEAVARAAAAAGAALLHLSSDMVFDGENAPYDEDSPPAPITAYGRAKADAEARVARAHRGAVIVRTSLLYSLAPLDPRTARIVADLAARRRVVFFTDERRCPAEVVDVAAAVVEAARRLASASGDRARAGIPPVIHLAGPEPLTRWDLGIGLLEALAVSCQEVEAGTLAESGLVRPRDLTMVARRTPAELTRSIRPLARVIASHGTPSWS